MYLVMMGEGRSFFTTVPESALARKYCQTIKQLVTLIRDNKLDSRENQGRGQATCCYNKSRINEIKIRKKFYNVDKIYFLNIQIK